MGRGTHGPYLLAAIELNDIKKVSDILSTKFRDQKKVKIFLTSEVKRLASEYKELPLFLAAYLPDPTIIKYMVQTHGADINFIYEYGFIKKKKCALIIAVKRGLYETVDAIIGLNSDSNVQDHKGRTPLHHAIRRANYRMVKMLLSRGAQTTIADITGNTPLHVATIYGHTELVHLLMKYGGDLYRKGQMGAIPIHMAAKEGHSNLIQTFSEIFGVNPNVKVPCYDGLEKAPIHVAARNGHAETVFALLNLCGADVNAMDTEGNTPLHYTVLDVYDPLGMKSKDDYAETVKVLVNAGSDVNHQNGRGETAMHLAARSEYQKVIEILVMAGCDSLLEDNNKNRAVDLVGDEDAVSRQTIKNAMEDRDKILYDSAEVRARGFSTNFQRNASANASTRSLSLFNMNAMIGSSHNKMIPPMSGSRNFMANQSAGHLHPMGTTQTSNSSSNSSKLRSDDRRYIGSSTHHLRAPSENSTYIESRRAKSVEHLDSHRRKMTKHRDRLQSKEERDYRRQNSYQASEATSMWSVTPPGSVNDLVSERRSRKHKNHHKKKMDTYDTIREASEFDGFSDVTTSQKHSNRHKYDNRSMGSEEFYLDDESMEELDKIDNKSHGKSKRKNHVSKWVDSQNRYTQDEYTSSSSSSTSSESESTSESDSSHGKRRRNKPHPPTKPKFPSDKNSSRQQIDKIIQLEVDDRTHDGQTTIKVIPLDKHGQPKTRKIPKNKTGSTFVGFNTNDDHKKTPPKAKKPSEYAQERLQEKKDTAKKPIPIKRGKKKADDDNKTNKMEDKESENQWATEPNSSKSKSESKEGTFGTSKKSSNMVFARAGDAPMDNMKHSNLARISAGDSAIPSKPSYSSGISGSQSINQLDNSSKSIQRLQNKMSQLTAKNENYQMSKSFEVLNSSASKSFNSNV